MLDLVIVTHHEITFFLSGGSKHTCVFLNIIITLLDSAKQTTLLALINNPTKTYSIIQQNYTQVNHEEYHCYHLRYLPIGELRICIRTCHSPHSCCPTIGCSPNLPKRIWKAQNRSTKGRGSREGCPILARRMGMQGLRIHLQPW